MRQMRRDFMMTFEGVSEDEEVHRPRISKQARVSCRCLGGPQWAEAILRIPETAPSEAAACQIRDQVAASNMEASRSYMLYSTAIQCLPMQSENTDRASFWLRSNLLALMGGTNISNFNTTKTRRISQVKNRHGDYSQALQTTPRIPHLRVTPGPKTCQITRGNTSTGLGHGAHYFSSNLSSNPV
ncbi:hypothetical protein O181_059703 [Austropuccinia psidii MF-1]|uniref:Uncharacterized protein n=1 Tax=Austropuccinia psidii MF-1 TaxID=1389203 RepID=A0A9Q3EJB1_9BASI|nr:hypothetical protein [Austropuccinia psidii MF-1]